jgi:hypothetical protein
MALSRTHLFFISLTAGIWVATGRKDTLNSTKRKAIGLPLTALYEIFASLPINFKCYAYNITNTF